MTRAERESIAAAPSGGPRFALRFEDGRGLLSLAKPLRFAYGTIEALELGLGELSFPLDLSGGAARFRTRRTRVRSARVIVDIPELVPDRLIALSPIANGMAWALTDAFGTLAFDASLRAEGADVWIAIGAARAATEGPAPPLLRAMAVARASEIEIDPERGALRVRRALSTLLMHALVPHGWRVPDDRHARIAIEILGRRRALVRTLGEGEAEPAIDDAPFERARRLADVVQALSSGDRDGARRAWERVRERLPELPEALVREAQALAVDPSIDRDHPIGITLALRAALRAGDVLAASSAARALADVEPCDAVAVEGLCAAAELADPGSAAELLERALGRKPRDPRVALRLIEALARLERSDALRAAIEGALVAREPGPDRGALAREAALVCEIADRPEEAARLVRIAAEYLPHDPKVLAGLAKIEERAGDHEAALRSWDRTTDVEDDEDARRRALRGAARAAEKLGRLEIAEERLARAEGDPSALAALARVRRAMGADAAARRAEDALLDHAQGPAGAEIGDALAAAAGAALASDALERGRAFVSALARVRPAHRGLRDLADEIDARDVDAWSRDPRRILSLDPTRIATVLASVRDPEAILAALPIGEDAPRLAAAAALAEPRIATLIASALSGAADLVDDPEAIAKLETIAVDPDERARWAGALADRLSASSPGRAAFARARVAAIHRDTASLRAALSAAERAGDRDAARAIVDLALEVVGEGPARRMLEAARDRLR